MSGEAADANMEGVELARQVLHGIIEQWSAKHGAGNIANADETGLLWKALPSKTLSTTRESGYKLRKDRMTACFAVTAKGEKLVMAVINKSETPRSFGSFRPQQLGIWWYSNKKAWMRKEIFSPMMQR